MSQLEHLAGVVQLRQVPYNTVIVQQGTVADAMFFIKTGAVRVVRRMAATPALQQCLAKDPLLSARYAPTTNLRDRYVHSLLFMK